MLDWLQGVGAVLIVQVANHPVKPPRVISPALPSSLH